MQTISRKGQWGRNRSGARSARFVEGHDFSRAVTAAKWMGLQPLRFSFCSCWNPQRLYARFQRNVCWKRYSPNCMATCREWQKCPLPFLGARRSRRTRRFKLFDCMSAKEILGVTDGVTHLSEIPCRVSSDLHEWRNESATVLPTGTANL